MCVSAINWLLPMPTLPRVEIFNTRWVENGVVGPGVGPHVGLAQALYFSGITFATVGYGDFVPADLDGVHLVVAATDDPKVRETVAQSAAARGIPCNVVDVNHLCTFYAPAILRRGAMTISVATDGKFPLLAVAIRDRLAAALGESIGPPPLGS